MSRCHGCMETTCELRRRPPCWIEFTSVSKILMNGMAPDEGAFSDSICEPVARIRLTSVPTPPAYFASKAVSRALSIIESSESPTTLTYQEEYCEVTMPELKSVGVECRYSSLESLL